MQCPLCKIEAAIAKTRYVVEDDKTPDVETKLYIEHDMTCRNPNCANFKNIISTVRNELQLSKESTETSEELNETDSVEEIAEDNVAEPSVEQTVL